jgi:hypothetical protein
MNALEEFRFQKDQFFQHSPRSPLTPDQRAAFHGLSYFPENPELDLTVNVEVFSEKKTIPMQTSTGDVQRYERYARFSVEVDGQAAGLTIFRGPHGYFLPFVDSLAGAETYPVGRYLEPEEITRTKFHVNFNLAYNPYCAYNELWSCPIPPAENRIPLPIRAGEKVFPGHAPDPQN